MRPTFLRRRAALAAAVTAALAASLTIVHAQAAGIDIHQDADAADIGLPLYPGAVKKPARDSDHAGLSFGLWGGSFGLKLAAVSYVSSDGVDAVAGFYRDALAKYGPVLDCSQNKPKHKSGSKGGTSLDIDSDKGASKPVTCGDDGPDVAGGRVYKVGTQGDQRLFELKPMARGVSFDLVHLQLRGTD
jgi:hypothetical protein